MIIGTVAAARTATASSSGPDLGSALVAIDFTRQRYFISGTEVSLADVLDRTDMTIDNDGAIFDFNTSDQPARLTPAAAAALGTNGFSLIFKWRDRESGFDLTPLVLENNDSNYGFIWIESDPDFAEALNDDAFLSNSLFSYSVPEQLSAQERHAGITRTVSGGFRVCFNGGAIQTLGPSGSYVPIFDEIAIGGWHSDSVLSTNSYVQWLIFYPAMSDAALQALTDL